MPAFDLFQWMMLAAGLIVAGLSSWFLLKTRAAGRRFRFEGETPGEWQRLSFPTRVCIGMVGLLVAYHLIVWVFPPSLTAVQLVRTRWWLWGVIGLGACGLSVLLDQREQQK